MKRTEYQALVTARKACQRCAGLENPATIAEGRYDSEEIGPWTLWQGDLEARLMVVGQDWGDTAYFLRHRGQEASRNPTNERLAALLDAIGLPIGSPAAPRPAAGVFLTNACLCLKRGGLQGAVQAEWFRHCASFLRGQIELVGPAVVVALGRWAYESVLRGFGLRAGPFRRAVETAEGVRLPSGAEVLPVYHCGARILNTHRSFPDAAGRLAARGGGPAARQGD
jgi:DNA polymerase